MAHQARNPLNYPDNRPLEQHVENNTSNTTGNLENQDLDIDARTLALLGKRQRLNVCLRTSIWWNERLHTPSIIAKFWTCVDDSFLGHDPRVLGICSLV